MPIYAYKCANCGHQLDVLQKVSDAPLSVCPSCGAAALGKQVTAAGFQLKGSGWYVTDFRDGGKKKEPLKPDTPAVADVAGDGAAKEGAAKDGAAKDGAKATTDAKTETKTDAAKSGAATSAAASGGASGGASTSTPATSGKSSTEKTAAKAPPPATGGVKGTSS